MSNDNFDEFEQSARQYTKIIMEYLEIVSEKSGMPLE